MLDIKNKDGDISLWYHHCFVVPPPPPPPYIHTTPIFNEMYWLKLSPALGTYQYQQLHIIKIFYFTGWQLFERSVQMWRSVINHWKSKFKIYFQFLIDHLKAAWLRDALLKLNRNIFKKCSAFKHLSHSIYKRHDSLTRFLSSYLQLKLRSMLKMYNTIITKNEDYKLTIKMQSKRHKIQIDRWLAWVKTWKLSN